MQVAPQVHYNGAQKSIIIEKVTSTSQRPETTKVTTWFVALQSDVSL